MLDPKLVRTETSEIAEKLAVKKYKFDIELFASLEESRKEIQSRTEELQNERNTRSKSCSQVPTSATTVSANAMKIVRLSKTLKIAFQIVMRILFLCSS